MKSRYQNNQFPFCDIDLMALVLTLDQDVVNSYHHTKIEVSIHLIQMLQPEHTHTHTQQTDTERHI